MIVVVCVALLLTAASGLRRTRLGLDFISSLPAGSEVRRAADAAAAGFWPGILSPTEVLVQRPGVGSAPGAAQLEQSLRGRRGVAGVLGPLEQQAVPGVDFAVAPGAAAVRYLVVFRSDPLGSAGIADYNALTGAMPGLLARTGLSGASAQYGGDTALAAFTVQRTVGDLGRIAVVVAVVDLVLMMIFLRALVAPFYLLGASVLALAAALGITTYLFQVVLGTRTSPTTYRSPPPCCSSLWAATTASSSWDGSGRSGAPVHCAAPSRPPCPARGAPSRSPR